MLLVAGQEREQPREVVVPVSGWRHSGTRQQPCADRTTSSKLEVKWSLPDELTIGELAARSGVATSALRFYEQEGLIASRRTSGNQRRYRAPCCDASRYPGRQRAAGIPLRQIGRALDTLPTGRTPTKHDWDVCHGPGAPTSRRGSRRSRGLRDQLTSCIGCGCLSLRTCALFNAGDRAAGAGQGARYLLGDSAG